MKAPGISDNPGGSLKKPEHMVLRFFFAALPITQVVFLRQVRG
jgi:hypothetical protein